MFTPDRAFDMVTKAQIMKLKGPSVKLVDLVCQEVLGISRDISAKVVKSGTSAGTNTNLLTNFNSPSITGQAAELPKLKSLCHQHLSDI